MVHNLHSSILIVAYEFYKVKYAIIFLLNVGHLYGF